MGWCGETSGVLVTHLDKHEGSSDNAGEGWVAPGVPVKAMAGELAVALDVYQL